MPARRLSGIRPGLAIVSTVIVMTTVAAACGSSNKKTSPTTTTSSTTVSSTTPSSTTTTASGSAAVDIYLVHKEKLAAAGRTVAGTATPETALQALVAGPKGSLERGLVLTTEIPTGTTVNGVTVSGDTATVDLSKSFESGGGSLSMQARVAQAVFTVTQFSGITRVRFELDGTPVTTIGGEGVMVDGVGRSAFANVTPAILVESPTPGATVRSPIAVRGIENTFEQTVNYTLTDPHGLILKEGFTTGAGPGAGSWGSFAFAVSYTAKGAGMGELVVYQVSGEDGSHRDFVQIPVVLS
jgi:germination protein M